MHAAPFIFSHSRKWRIRRHLTFWVAWWLFAGFIYSVGPLPVNLAYGSNLLRATLESLAYLPLHIFLAYWLNYLVIPRYLVTGKYTGINIYAACFLYYCHTFGAHRLHAHSFNKVVVWRTFI